MERVPLEVITRHACNEIGKFFANQAENERKSGRVAVLVEDFTNSIYYMPCDEYGYPQVHTFNYLTFDSLNLSAISEKNFATPTTMIVKETSIYIESPMLTQRYGVDFRPIVFMWKGRKMSSRDIPLERLNVSELMKLAQQVIVNREGLVIDEALKNKIYK